MKALNQIIENAKNNPKSIVLAEGHDPRIVEAGIRVAQDGIAQVTLLGNPQTIKQEAEKLSLALGAVNIIDPDDSDKHQVYAQALHEKRGHKGVTLEQAQQMVKDPLCFSNMMVAVGDADGSVAGSVYTTADVVRTALQLIGVSKSAKMVSSFFLMMMCEPFHNLKGGIIFSDCGLVVDPDAEGLAEIAMTASNSARNLLGIEPKVAMLSFSTSGSAKHPLIDKVVSATNIVKSTMPDLAIDGEVQLDAAIVEQVANKKVSESKVKGQANVLIFPNLDAGNIGYKMAERVGGAKALGPLLQGLAKPANDLSRGCSAEDVYNVIAVTVNQAQAN